MPELILLSFNRTEIIALNRAACNGDAEATTFLDALWNPYRDRAIACFLCDAAVEFPVFSEVVGDLTDASKASAVPLCAQCRGLPGSNLNPYPVAANPKPTPTKRWQTVR